MYCVKCKKPTDTSNVQFAVSKNGRNMKRGTCVICRTTKTQFIIAQKGGSLLNKAINNLPFEMHLPGHNFTGPGTKLKKRLNPDLTPKEWSKPVNRVDKAAYHHDVCYLIKALKTLVWHLSREPMKDMSSSKKYTNSNI